MPDGLGTVADLIGWLKSRGTGYGQAFADPALIRCAVDQEFAARMRQSLAPRKSGFFRPSPVAEWRG